MFEKKSLIKNQFYANIYFGFNTSLSEISFIFKKFKWISNV